MANDFPTPNEWLYIRGLTDTSKVYMKRLFSVYANVISVHPLSETTAYVQCEDTPSATRVIQYLHKKLIGRKQLFIVYKKKDPSRDKRKSILDCLTTAGSRQTRAVTTGANSNVGESHTIAANKEVLFYLKAANLQRKFRSYKVKAYVNLANSCVVIEGSSNEYVVRAQEELTVEIANLKTHQTPITAEWEECYNSLEMTDVVKAFQASKVKAGLDIRDSYLYTCSNCQGEAEKAAGLVLKLIQLRTYPPDGGQLPQKWHEIIALNSDQWKRHIRFITELFPGVVIVYDDISKTIRIASPESTSMPAVISHLERYFSHQSMKFATFSFDDEDQVLLIELNSNQLKAEHPSIQLTFYENKKLCRLESMDDLEPAVQSLQRMKGSIVSVTDIENSEVFYDWISKGSGRAKLADICQMSKIIINFHKGRTTSSDQSCNFKQLVKVLKGDMCDLQRLDDELIVVSEGRIYQKFAASNHEILSEGINMLPSGRYVYYIPAVPRSNFNDVLTWEWLRETVKEVLQVAIELNIQSVAFPALGTGSTAHLSSVVAKEMCMGVSEMFFTKANGTNLPRVSVILDENRPDVNVMEQLFQSEFRRLSYPEENCKTHKCIEVKFMALSVEALSKAQIKYAELRKANLRRENWANSPLRHGIGELSPAQTYEIMSLSERLRVTVTIQCKEEILQIEGLTANVEAVKNRVNQLLQTTHGAAIKPVTTTIPLTWDHQALRNKQIKVVVADSGPEFSQIEKLFQMSAPAGTTVKQVYRIQNRHLYQQYEVQKRRVMDEMGLTEAQLPTIEKQLWHGTDADSARSIYTGEFNRSFAGKNGMTYGQGVYFFTTVRHSAACKNQLSYDGSGNRFLILSRVVFGRYIAGNSGIDRKNLPAGVHSTVDRVDNPSIYVVYDDAVAYPEYEVQF